MKLNETTVHLFGLTSINDIRGAFNIVAARLSYVEKSY
jgi:hypothetical protein